MPIIVLVAIFNNLFSITSEIPRRLMVAVVDVLHRVRQCRERADTGRRHTTRTDAQLRRERGGHHPQSSGPERACVPVHALKQAAPLAVVTAFVSEYFGGPQNGLGSRITQADQPARETPPAGRTCWPHACSASRSTCCRSPSSRHRRHDGMTSANRPQDQQDPRDPRPTREQHEAEADRSKRLPRRAHLLLVAGCMWQR